MHQNKTAGRLVLQELLLIMEPLVTWPMFLLLQNLVEKALQNARPANTVRTGLMEVIMDHPGLQGLRRWLLATQDAHGLYAQFGFLPLDKPERIMGFKPFEEYPKTNS